MGTERGAISAQYRHIQAGICTALESLDGAALFSSDTWQRAEGGGGLSRLLQDGNLIEKGGVNFSAVEGPLHPGMQRSLGVTAADFYATGVSIVLHPHSPLVPIIHMNIRYFEAGNRWWFGGGIDLTPHYVDTGDAQYFHSALQKICLHYHPEWYAAFKQEADTYFYLPHRGETRGIGGIFFDRLSEDSGVSKERLLQFTADLGTAFPTLYAHIANRHRHESYSESDLHWQRLRRGRYVEFNLVYDRGTRFGLESEGRTESILMSLPPEARWAYDYQPPPDSRAAQTIALLAKGIDWCSKERAQ